MTTSLHLRVLGPIEVLIDGQRVDLGSPKARMLLAALAVNRGRVVTVGTLVETLWGEEAPATARKSIHKYVSQLRQLLGAALATRPAGYVVDLDDLSIDAVAFENAVKTLTELSDEDIEEALALWRGEPYPELASTDWGPTESSRLTELRLQAMEALVERRLASGRHSEVIGELETMVAAHPFRERLWAQLMLAMYRSGRQSDALAAYQRLRRRLGEELGIEPSSDLKELEERILLHDPSLTPLIGPTRHNLPAALTSFIGRRREMAELTSLLEVSRLVVLLGTAGSGKTRLATETGRAVFDRFSDDGVWFVDLAPVRSADGVADAIAKALGVGRLGDQDTDTILVDHVRARRLLLVLDNCEHLLARVAQVAQRLLEGSPGLVVLATSRERLGVPGESILEVNPLPYPDETEPVTKDFDAVRLFVDRVRAVSRDDDPGMLFDVVGEIVRRLDGIPLALELAAARAHGLGLVGLRDHLDDRFSVLSSPAGIDRHQTLEAAVDWSYRLLSGPEQILFGRLSVFRGGFDMNAAVDVCGHEPLDRPAVAALVAGLVDKSLVVAGGVGRRRYILLETLREFAMRVVDSTESAPLRDAHADYFLRFAEEAAEHLKGPEQTDWRTLLRMDHDNLRKALHWAATTSPEKLVRLAVALAVFWDSVGPRSEGHERLRRAVEVSQGLDPLLRIEALLRASDLYSSQHASLPREYAKQALAEARAIGDRRGEARALRALSWALVIDGRTEEARTVGMEALDLFAGQDDPWELALWSERMGQASYRDPEWSIGMLQQALDLYRSVGDRSREALVLYKIAEQLSGSHGDLELAVDYAERAIAISEAVGNVHDGAHARLEYGKVLRRAGRLGESAAVLSESVTQLTRQGDERCTVRALSALGITQLDAGDLTSGEKTLRESLHRGAALAERRTTRTALAGMARIAAETGASETAVILLGYVDELGSALDIPAAEASRGKRDARLSMLKTRVGAEEFDRLWERGRDLRMDDATALALAPRTATGISVLGRSESIQDSR
jgi:predicted ATPase